MFKGIVRLGLLGLALIIAAGCSQGDGSGKATSQATDVMVPDDIFWLTESSMPTGRIGSTASAVGSKIYTIGRLDGSNGSSSSMYNNNLYYAAIEEYDLLTNMRLTKASMPTSRTGFAVGVVGNKIYAIGGWDGFNYLTAVEEYDPLTDKWRTKAQMPTGRASLSIGVVRDRIYAIGGWDSRGHLNVVEKYDPVTDRWATKAPMPTDRFDLDVNVANDRIYIYIIREWDGSIEEWDRSNNLTAVAEYDPMTDQWTTLASMPTGLF
jgi:hypothetical protein